MTRTFPRTVVGGVSLPRLLIGTNWVLGYSHTGGAADNLIRTLHNKPGSMTPLLAAYLEYGIDAIMGPISSNAFAMESLAMAEEALGHKFIRIDTPLINVDDSAEARREAEATIRRSAQSGATFCLIHHASMEQLVNKNRRTIDRLPDYLAMMREHGLLPGLSAHMPEAIVYADANEYDVETYIQIFNAAGFLMQVEIESVARIIHHAKKPVMTIKPCAAGRITPYVGLTFNWNALRPCDMVTIGALTAHEVHEDAEISFAAFDHRLPDLAGRASPAPQQAVLHK